MFSVAFCHFIIRSLDDELHFILLVILHFSVKAFFIFIFVFHCYVSSHQGWRQEFSERGLTLPMRGLKYGFQGIVNAKNLRQNSSSLSDGGLACSDRWL